MANRDICIPKRAVRVLVHCDRRQRHCRCSPENLTSNSVWYEELGQSFNALITAKLMRWLSRRTSVDESVAMMLKAVSILRQLGHRSVASSKRRCISIHHKQGQPNPVTCDLHDHKRAQICQIA